MENLDAARPQSGLNAADMVYEYETEGGISRFSAFFFKPPATAVGPVRSARLATIKLLQIYEATLLYSGASSYISAILSHMRACPQTALNLMGEMARRLRRADEAIVGLALQDVEGRLSKTLMRLAKDDGDISVDGGLLLRRRPTQQELANMVGSSRETVSRTFASLIRRGLMVPKGRTLVLTDRMLGKTAHVQA